MTGKDCTAATVCGASVKILDSYAVNLPNKHHKGGQSAARFGSAFAVLLCTELVVLARSQPTPGLTSATTIWDKSARTLCAGLSEATTRSTCAASSSLAMVRCFLALTSNAVFLCSGF